MSHRCREALTRFIEDVTPEFEINLIENTTRVSAPGKQTGSSIRHPVAGDRIAAIFTAPRRCRQPKIARIKQFTPAVWPNAMGE